ncbi:MAG: polyamine aminopropyltransferase [Corynebacterium sp.]|uniref:polyamine aminopropyltransferase n=1 Tax=Corynebacterium sp. TaxID=1720 RepID=UPI0026DB68A3|nr:polyamine aminopropyltransferase [Corynebacterium sp.]MDO4762395.1 polyamine aminopropyltransferase [Corynebacterium sp.]
MSAVVLSPARRFLLLVSVSVCAASGLVYELALISLSAVLAGGSVVETSLIVAGFVAALGLGALAAKPLLTRAEVAFLSVEALLGLVGGLSALVLYWAFAVVGNSLAVLGGATLVIGMLVGAELPLLMTLFQRGKLVDATTSGSVLATLNAADYLGALIGGVAWPFVLLPFLGVVRGTLAAGLLNVCAALVIAVLVLRRDVPRRQFAAIASGLCAIVVVLVSVLVASDGLVTSARQRLYAFPIVYFHQSKYQEIVVTQWGKDRRLFLNGGLQYSTRDEYRYTESLTYPVVDASTSRVLIIGGGDGLAARELLKFPQVKHITQVELDPDMVAVANSVLRDDNAGALGDPRVTVLLRDAFTWVRTPPLPQDRFDAIVVDLPDPDNEIIGRLYSQEFYSMLLKHLAPGGAMTVQSGSAFTTPDVFSRVYSTLLASGCASVVPYHVHVPTFGDWGFNFCTRTSRGLVMPKTPAHTPRFVDQGVLDAARVFGADNKPRLLPANTLDRPLIVADRRRGYRQAGE